MPDGQCKIIPKYGINILFGSKVKNVASFKSFEIYLNFAKGQVSIQRPYQLGPF